MPCQPINEDTARAFVTRMEGKVDIYCLRIGNVMEPHEYAKFPTFFKDPGGRKKLTWSYVDARDLGEITRCCIETDGLGFQTFVAASEDNSSDLPTPELLKRFYPRVPVKGTPGHWDALLSPKKAQKMLGFKQKHYWRNHVRGYDKT